MILDSEDCFVYTYDNGGNITSVKEYAYTTGEISGTPVQKTYTYGDTEWKDLLTNYNGTAITYDAIGNPLNWTNGKMFTWTAGRQLSGVTDANNTITYTYDDNGIRTGKTVNGIKTDYYLNGTAIIMQKTGDNCIWYTYDESGNLSGLRVGSSEYYYYRNGQGDIIGIIDGTGSIAAKYSYDAWGNPVAITDGNGNDVSGNAGHIANINPFRYRGYFYDVETGLYYLQSRYYDSQVGRFVNADGIIGANQDIMGYNLFAYCSNNPINYSDPSGSLKIPNYFKIAIRVSIKMLKTALFGDGTSQYYGPKSVVSKTLSKSAIMKEELNKNVQTAKDSGAKSTTITGSVSLYGKDNKYDFDLSYSVGKANYSMEIVQETKTTGIWFWKKEKVRYVTTVTVMDTYNFDEYRNDGSFGSMLNNWGYDMQNAGNLTPFYWEATYTVKGKWVNK